MAKKVYIGVPPSLPANYTQLEYIKFSGSQYFDIVFNPGNYLINGVYSPAKLEIDFVREGTAAQYLYGTVNTGNTACFTAYLGASGGTGNWRFGATSASLKIAVGTRYTAVMSGIGVNLNGTDHKYSATPGTWSTSYSLYIGTGNTSGSASTSRFVGKIYSIKLWSQNDGSLIRNLVPCKNSSGVIGFYDLVGGTWFTNNGTGSFVAGPVSTAAGFARDVKKMYWGVSTLARKVKKAYLGVGGVARPVFSYGGKVTCYGLLYDDLDQDDIRTGHAATSIGGRAMFGGGGYTNKPVTNLVDCFEKDLVRSTVNLSVARRDLAATTVGGYALFGGGNTNSSSSLSSVVDAFDASKTRKSVAALSVAREWLTAATVGDYAIFSPHSSEDMYDSTDVTVDAYSSSLVKNTNIQNFPTSLGGMSAASVGDYAIFSGAHYYSIDYDEYMGGADSYETYSYAYNKSLTANFNLDDGTYYAGIRDRSVTTIGKYALYCGGRAYSSDWREEYNDYWEEYVYSDYGYFYEVNDVVALDSSLTYHEINATNVSQAYDAQAATLGDFALFTGGLTIMHDDYDDDYEEESTSGMDVFDASLTHILSESGNGWRYLQQSRCYHKIATAGDFAILYGGYGLYQEDYGDIYMPVNSRVRTEIYTLA